MRNQEIDQTLGNAHERAEQYKREFWGTENLSFNEPWYRLVKAARIIAGLAGRAERSLLDIGCGPAALMRQLPSNISYYGIDIAIQEPARTSLRRTWQNPRSISMARSSIWCRPSVSLNILATRSLVNSTR